MAAIARIFGFVIVVQLCGLALCHYDDDDDVTESMAIEEIIARASVLGRHEEGDDLGRLADGNLVEEIDIESAAEGDTGSDDDGEKRRYKRKAVRDLGKRWPNGIIPYTIRDGDFEPEQEELILTALRIWEETTCLRFPRATSDDRRKVIFRHGSGCTSEYGMGRRPQRINLGWGCRNLRTILHETGHAIGLRHEHERPDRDNYLWVRPEQVVPQRRPALLKKSDQLVNTYGVGYDYSSLMHFGENTFKDDDEKGPVIIASDPAWQLRMGKANNLSFWDIKIVNLMYDCSDHCNAQTCPEGSFIDKNCECICPGDPVRKCSDPEVEKESCYDTAYYCEKYRRQGICWKKRSACGKTCKFCGPDCQDKRSDCLIRARRGECKKDPNWMFNHCRLSCGICWGLPGDGTCLDEESSCAIRASRGDCSTEEAYMKLHCKRSCAWC